MALDEELADRIRELFALVAARGALPTPVTLGLLLAAALPFAALTWWSVATPLIAILLLAIGALTLRAARPPTIHH